MTTDTPRTDCPHCGCQTKDPFGMGKTIHNVENCKRNRQLAEARAEVERLREAIVTAYTHNQNMHCYQTKGRLNDELNNQTMVLRKALKPTNK